MIRYIVALTLVDLIALAVVGAIILFAWAGWQLLLSAHALVYVGA